jgi:protein gp37
MALRLACIEFSKFGAKMTAKQGKYTGVTNLIGRWNGKIFCDESVLEKPLHWKKPRRIFVCSMGDLFHPKVPFEFINKIALTMSRCSQHTFQILTKRPEIALEHTKNWQKESGYPSLFSDNVWFGTTICNQKEADEKIPILLQIPAAVRFVSLEPLLSDIDIFAAYACKCECGWVGEPENGCSEAWEPEEHFEQCPRCKRRLQGNYELGMDSLDWIIIGCEKLAGNKAGRFADKFNDAAINIVGQCNDACVPVFVKQIPINGKVVTDIKKFPKELRYQEWPK